MRPALCINLVNEFPSSVALPMVMMFVPERVIVMMSVLADNERAITSGAAVINV